MRANEVPVAVQGAVHDVVHGAVTRTVRLGAATTAEVAQIVVDNTVGRMLDTDPDRVR